MRYFILPFLVACSLGLVACSSGDDDGDDDDDDDDTTTTTSSSGSSENSSGSQSGSGGAKAECSSIDDCEKLSCTCGGFSGAEVQKCDNGVCAKTCEAAGCE